MTALPRLRLLGRYPLGHRRAVRGPARRSLVLPVVAACALTSAAVVALPASEVAAKTVAGSPVGGVNSMNTTAGGLLARGWAFDPDVPTEATEVTGWVDGKNVSLVTANLSRPDVAKAYPAAGDLHGFEWRIPVPEGRHTVCLHLVNVGRGSAVQLTCRTTTFDYGPAGALGSVVATRGTLRVQGWAVDGDASTTPLTVRVTVDGVASSLTADRPRADIAKKYPDTGTKHGFDHTYSAAQGTHRVCAGVVNIGYGSNTALGCRTVVLDDRPIGALDPLTTVSGKLRIKGWALDRDATGSPLTVSLRIDSGAATTLTANRSRTDVGRAYPGTGTTHGFDTSVTVPEGKHTICVTARNVGFGSDRALPCRSLVVDFTPKASLATAAPTKTGVSVTGWAYDPDTSASVKTHILLDGSTAAVVTANRKGRTRSGHNFTATVPATSGRHTICAVAINVLWGSHNSTQACRSSVLTLSPLGSFDSLTRAPGSTDLLVYGWAADPDSAGALAVTGTLDGQTLATMRAGTQRPDVGAAYPSLGSAHGLSATLAADGGEHRVCLTAVNVGGGASRNLGCRLINAVHPVPASTPLVPKAIAGYGGATISWAPSVSDGGAPVSTYSVTSSPGNVTVSVPATSTSAVIVGLKASTTYTFAVRALNVAGASSAGVSPAVRTEAGPPAQRTPAPISTSRYIRNVRGSSASELAMMRAEGAADAKRNVSGHGYLVLLDIGGQDQYNGGVVLSAGVRFVGYSDLVRDVQAYTDGYASAQRASAPVVIAIGTNNDMDVSAATGKVWADTVVDPVRAYAARHVGMTIAGANDIEPGFRASYAATKKWLSGYLAATPAPFIFNGSADGCAWTTTNRSCNNGWTMAGLHYLAAGAAPTRMLNLPQVYNNTMADQWKYISLTGVVNHLPRINFAGVLTEATACAQAGGCGSMSGHSAWARMWKDLQSDSRLQVSSLPYSTDLRIDR